ncbi:hypothetical protein FSOLCH5_013163 [Fusarium solani]
MHCGMAIRIMQSLHSSRISPHALDISQNNDMDELAVVVETRTYWACFIMDCTINSGTYNPRMLPMPEMQKLKVPRPPNFFDFAFGSDGASLSQNLTANHSDPSGNLDLAQSFETIVLGFDIYAQAMAFVFNNGRTIMLHREYFPFLPTAESTPQGPIHPPLLEAEAPPGWWEDSAKELYGAAEQITCLLQEASECGIPLMTPFSGFCAFTACFLNLYIFRFPKMNLGRSPRAEQLMNWGLEYLEEFQNAWELAGGWIKTIQNSSLLYKSATEDSGRFRGRSRADFETLHQSIHEYRIVDRSDLHLQQIRRADRNSSRDIENDDRVGREQAQVPMGLNPTGNPAFLDPFPNWWSMLQEVEFAEISSMMN